MTSTNSVQGFLLTRQWHESGDGQELIYWVATDSGPVKLVFPYQESLFFVCEKDFTQIKRIVDSMGRWRHAQIALKGFDGEPMIACYFQSQRGLNMARSRLSKNFQLFEADIRPTDRYLMERFITASVEVEGPISEDNGFVTYDSPRIRPADYLPDLKVVSLDIETSFSENILYSIAVQGDGLEKVFMVGNEEPGLVYLEFLPDEKSLIVKFLEWFNDVDPDVVIGWSVVGFDLHFLQMRCDVLSIDFTLGRGKQVVSWRTATQGRERRYALVPGRVVLDGIELLRTATFRFESFALDSVAKELLGRGKLIDDVDQRASEIQDLYANDKTQLARYNLEDCVLVSEIFDKANLIKFALERSRLTGLELDRSGGSVAAFDFLYLPRLHRKGFVAPLVDEGKVVASPGGYVLESMAGLYDHVIVLDFKSLYPSIIRTFHVDPLAMILAENEEDPIPGYKGAEFSREDVILPRIIEELWAARDVAKQSGEAAMSQAIKIIMNSFYGVLGSAGCRFFDTKLVSSITLRGHEILQKTRDLIEEQGLRVIYGDTDSVFVHLKNVTTNEEADAVGVRLMGFLNDWWRDHLLETLHLESCLEVEYETHFNRFLMPTVRGSEVGSKKRYAGMVEDLNGSQMVFKGLETVRSDWSPLAREFQQILYRKIFLEEPYEDYIRNLVTEVNTGQCDAKLVLRKRLRRKLEDYQKNVPPHVRAARMAEEIRRERGLPNQFTHGGWVEYIMTVNGAEPRAYFSSKIDYQFYVDKQLAPIADAILFFKSTSLAKLTDRQLGLF
ncbi:MAG: DNA polymerase II [bacterium]|nr:DNA polymerase II [Gammaproteobacteria bacterium]HIL95573.1 DNA polymerase II [Pseudomonadales bacterium]